MLLYTCSTYFNSYKYISASLALVYNHSIYSYDAHAYSEFYREFYARYGLPPPPAVPPGYDTNPHYDPKYGPPYRRRSPRDRQGTWDRGESDYDRRSREKRQVHARENRQRIRNLQRGHLRIRVRKKTPSRQRKAKIRRM